MTVNAWTHNPLIYRESSILFEIGPAIAMAGRVSYELPSSIQKASQQRGSFSLAACNVPAWNGNLWTHVRLHSGLRQDLAKGTAMGALTLITAAVTLLLLLYLFIAMVRPEWF